MMHLKQLSYNIGGNPIIQDLDWRLERGQHALILGHSGSGKTTLLHLLAGLLTPSAGSLHINGVDITSLKGSALDVWRGRHIGMVFQTLHLVKALTIQDNLRLARAMAGLAPDDARAAGLLAKLGIADKALHYPQQLSVGQAQRVAIARAVINRPEWILADEPTSALDDMHCAATMELLAEQAAQCGATLIIATHDQRIRHHFQHLLELQTIRRQAA